MNSNQITFKEGESLNRPPLFEGENFSFWKCRMKTFMQAVDPDAWSAVANDPYVPTKIAGENKSHWNGKR